MEALASTEKLLQDKVNKTAKVVMLTARNDALSQKQICSCLFLFLFWSGMEAFNFYCNLSIVCSEWSFIRSHLCFFLSSSGSFCSFFSLICGHADLWFVCIIVRAVVNGLVRSSRTKPGWAATCFHLQGFFCASIHWLAPRRIRTRWLFKNLGASQENCVAAAVNFLPETVWSLTEPVRANP